MTLKKTFLATKKFQNCMVYLQGIKTKLLQMCALNVDYIARNNAGYNF